MRVACILLLSLCGSASALVGTKLMRFDLTHDGKLAASDGEIEHLDDSQIQKEPALVSRELRRNEQLPEAAENKNAAQTVKCSQECAVQPSKEMKRLDGCACTYFLMPDFSWKELWGGTEVDLPNAVAINALDDSTYPHDPAYERFKPFTGFISQNINLQQLTDFMGFVIDEKTYCNSAYLPQPNAHAIRVRQCDIHNKIANMQKDMQMQNVGFHAQWPVVSEEYFEYIDVLNAAADYAELPLVDGTTLPKREFVFVELGAGYGHWTFTAHRALSQKFEGKGTPRVKYLLVDVVQELLPTLQSLAQMNGVRMNGSSSDDAHFHAGMIGATGNEAQDQNVEHTQHQVYSDLWGLNPSNKVVNETQPIALAVAFDLYKIPCEIDMVDIDIQAAEYVLLNDEKTLDMLTARAHKVHIGLHRGQDESDKLKENFLSRGWELVWYFPTITGEGGAAPTPFGNVAFGDGILSIVNKNPIACDGSR